MYNQNPPDQQNPPDEKNQPSQKNQQGQPGGVQGAAEKSGVVGSAPAIVRFAGVRKTFETKTGTTIALEGVDLEIGQGEFVAVIGPSGCGKSTLLRLLCGLEVPTQGSILWPGLTGSGEQGAQGGQGIRFGVAFQEHRLLPWFNIEQNIALSTLMHRPLVTEDLERARGLCALVGLSGFEKRRPAELSGGMRQRAAFARALYSQPELMLLDEPFGALDALTRERIIDDAERIWMEQGFAAFLITHSIDEAVHLADRVIVMSARPGRIVMQVRIDLPRPRAVQRENPRYAQLCAELRRHLDI